MQLPLIETHLSFKALPWEKETHFQMKYLTPTLPKRTVGEGLNSFHVRTKVRFSESF